MAAVYALIDPRTHQACYIGKALDVALRERNHFKQWKWERSRKSEWMRELHAVGLRPEMIVIEECSAVESAAREKYWIARALSRGIPLLNMKHGGQGRLNTSDETRRKISEAVKGKGHGPEQCAAHAQFMRGRKFSAETKEKMARAQMGNQRAQKWDFLVIFPDGRREAIESIGAFCKEKGITLQRAYLIAAAGKGQTKGGLHFVRTERRKCSLHEGALPHGKDRYRA